MQFRRFVLVAALGAAAALAAPREPALVGTPPVARFTPDIPFYPQHFAIAQDGDGLVYFGGSDGLLLFDGARWQALPLPNRDLVRSLAWDGDERVYVGGYSLFGWYARAASGAVVYHDLGAQARELAGGEFADVWETLVLPEGVLFRALNHAFLFDPASGALRHWRHDGRFGIAYRDADGLVLQWRGEGFKRLTGESWTPIPGGDAPGFKDLVYMMLPLPDGGRLAAARSGGWLVLREGRAAPAALPRDLPPQSRIVTGLALDDGSLALAGDDGVLYVWDPRGDTVHRVRVSDERLSGVVQARDGGLLISAYSAFHRVEWPARWSAVGAEVGLRGALHGAARFGAERVALTGAGAVALRHAPDGELRAERLPWTDHEAWALLPLEGGRALFADSYALIEIDAAGAARKVSGDLLYPRVLQRSRFDHELVLIGTEHGLALARRGPQGWRVVAERTDPGAPNVREIVETAPGELWLGTERGGVMRARLEQGGRGIAALERFAGGPPLTVSRELRLTRLPEGALIASTPDGFYRLDGERFVADPVGGLAAHREPDALMSIKVAPDGTAWAWSRYALLRRPPGGRWTSEDIGAVRRGVLEDVGFGADGDLIVIATNALLFHHARAAPAAARPPQVMLRGVTLVDESGAASELALAPPEPQRIAQADNALRFRFALPELRQAGAARYRGRLTPFEPEFSEWASGAAYGYYRLKPGRYRFEVQARDADGVESAAPPFEFVIVPPWYASRAAQVVWALLALVVLAGLARALVARRTRRLAAETAALERKVDDRTRELADANRKLDTIAHLDGLTGLPNRRRLDDYLTQAWQLCGERERPLALLAIDVDRFKDYNDKHGHLAGDTLLKRLAPILSRHLRRTEDLAARYGGEEFLVVLPGADAVIARQVAEALREKVAESSIGATISVGVAAETPRSGRIVTELVALADAALYKAKAGGRNRVVVAGA